MSSLNSTANRFFICWLFQLEEDSLNVWMAVVLHPSLSTNLYKIRILNAETKVDLLYFNMPVGSVEL